MGRDFYIIGSKYGENREHDVFPEMVKKDAVSIGFASNLDLSPFYRQSHRKIIQHLKKEEEPSRSYSAHKYFLNLKPGDLIAIKSTGSPVNGKPCLRIVGYAIVEERDGIIYEHDPGDARDGELGHLIRVRFLETEIERELALGGYGRTIHRLSNLGHIAQIFDIDSEIVDPDVNDIRFRSRTTQKNVEAQVRYVKASSYLARAVHNKLQKQFFDYLVERHGEENVRMEEDYVDVKLLEGDSVTFYEIKPHHSVKRCIREALGQLLEYSWFNTPRDKRKIKLVVVGPRDPKERDKRYIEYIRSILNLDFEYLAFNGAK